MRMDLGLGPEIGFSDDRRRLRLDLHVYYCRTYYKALVTFTQLCDGRGRRRERRRRGRLRWIADWSKLGYRGRHPRGALGPAPSYSSRLQPGPSVDSDLEPDSGSDRLSCGLSPFKSLSFQGVRVPSHCRTRAGTSRSESSHLAKPIFFDIWSNKTRKRQSRSSDLP